MNTPTKVIVHHTNGIVSNPRYDTSRHSVDVIDAWHRKRWPNFTSKYFKNSRGQYYACGYHIVIETDGNDTQTRGYSETGAHCLGMNNSSIGICLVGNFDSKYPTQEQLTAFKERWTEIKNIYPHLTPHDVVPHRKYSTKSCFGNNLTDDYFQGIVMEGLEQEERDAEAQQKADRSKMLEIVEILQTLVAILTQHLASKRMKL